MTLICAWVSPDFVLIGSDSQFGDDLTGIRRSGRKLHAVAGKSIVWGLAGNADIYEYVATWIDSNVPARLKQRESVTRIADLAGEFVSQTNTRLMERGAAVRGGPTGK